MRWRAVVGFDDDAMVGFAATRSYVRLDDGRVVKLVAWPVRGRTRKRRGRYCRLENGNGTTFTLHVRRVAEVDVTP